MASPSPKPAEKNNTALSSDFERLQKIEESILTCVELASSLAEELAKVGGADSPECLSICKRFTQNVQSAQECIVEALDKHQGDRDFEVTVYPYMAKTAVLAEKIKVLQLYLDQMDNVLKETT